MKVVITGKSVFTAHGIELPEHCPDFSDLVEHNHSRSSERRQKKTSPKTARQKKGMGNPKLSIISLADLTGSS